MRLVTVRNTWSDLDSVEKAAVMLALLALTLAGWVLGGLPSALAGRPHRNARLPNYNCYD